MVFVAQLGDHCRANAELMDSNPFEARNLFFALICNSPFLACMFCYLTSDHVMVPKRIVSFNISLRTCIRLYACLPSAVNKGIYFKTQKFAAVLSQLECWLLLQLNKCSCISRHKSHFLRVINQENCFFQLSSCVLVSTCICMHNLCKDSLRSRRLEVVGTRKNGHVRTRVSLARARSLFHPLLPSACYAV